jgi:transposase
MTTTEEWTKRIEEWRASGLTSDRFCEGREFTANGLRKWAYRLGMTKRHRRKPKVGLARVVRVPSAAPIPGKIGGGTREESDSALAVELGGARVVVRAGFDRATLAAVLEVLAAKRSEQ